MWIYSLYRRGHALLAFCVVVSYLERALGDLFCVIEKDEVLA